MHNLKLATWNICLGMFHKVDIIKQTIYRENLDLLLLNETEINESHDTQYLKIPEYDLVTPLNKTNTRIAAYIRSDKNYKILCSNVKLDTISIQIEEIKILGIYRAYKLPNHDNYTDQMSELILEVNTHDIVMGDLNLDSNKRNINTYRYSNIYTMWQNEIENKNLNQINHQNTWTRTINGRVQESCLDHIYVKEQFIEAEFFQKTTTSDHDLIGRKLGQVSAKKSYNSDFYVRKWSNYSSTRVIEECNDISWGNYDKMTSQDMCDFLDLKLSQIVEKITPTVKRTSRSCKYLWNHKISRMLSNKQTLKRRQRRYPSQALVEKIKNLNDAIRNESASDIRKKVRNVIRPGDSKTFWKSVNLARNKGDFSQQSEIHFENTIAKTNHEKAQLFADYFEKTIKQLRAKSDVTDCFNGHPNDVIPDGNFFSPQLIGKLLSSIKKSQCAGFDRIPMIYLRDAAEVTSSKIQLLFEKIYNEKNIPEQWKIGKITPIPKKGRKNDVTNFRPITSLCALAKVLERCILNRITSLGDFTGQSQHGFKKNHSTNTAILQLQHEIAASLDDGLYHGVVSLDLSAAFDMVNPDLLINRMMIAGLPNDVTTLVKNWLTNRAAYVKFGGESSMFFNVPEGTVQGSVLGPILFAIFVAPMFELATVSSYADDSYLSEKNHDLNNMVTNLSTKANLLTNWFKASGLVVNESKTEFCVFHKNRKVTCQIQINDVIIKNTPTLKTLGITFDENLTWDHQIQQISKSCSKLNSGFQILKKFFTRTELLTLATSLYYSKMYYAAETWLSHGLSVRNQNALMSISAKVLKTVTGIKCNQDDGISFLELHKKTNRATPKMMTSYVQATCLHRIINNEVPSAIYLDLLTHHQELRRHYKPTFVKTNKTKIGENILRNRVQKTKNSLSGDWSVLSYDRMKIKAKRDFLTF